MAAKDDPIIIKKYANRRLYNTGTSTYVTLEDLAEMVKKGEEFTVQDAKTGDDITHPVLTQIIFELENKDGQNMLPIPFLRQLIAYLRRPDADDRAELPRTVDARLLQGTGTLSRADEGRDRQVAAGHDEDHHADQGAGGADAPQHGNVPECHAAVHAVPARGLRTGRYATAPSRPGRKRRKSPTTFRS